ncbi:hypothetical protein M405DRAFT_931994 [Rhizopogon salebrosus TDB-379]|nr:hypothetical protein M405DRAFT_931994 [Rhizopogon salebrosus TDB-379]
MFACISTAVLYVLLVSTVIANATVISLENRPPIPMPIPMPPVPLPPIPIPVPT